MARSDRAVGIVLALAAALMALALAIAWRRPARRADEAPRRSPWPPYVSTVAPPSSVASSPAPDRLPLAPDFKLKTANGRQTIELRDFRHSKPVALIFGAYSCPPFRRQAPALQALYRRYREDVEFFLIYVREPHPTDGVHDAAVSENLSEGLDIPQAVTLEDRALAARQMCRGLALDLPTLVDRIDDQTSRDYRGFPDRLFLIGFEGTIAYDGGQGPFSFNPDGLEAAIQGELGVIKPRAAYFSRGMLLGRERLPDWVLPGLTGTVLRGGL